MTHDPSRFETVEDAMRALPSSGPEWEAAIEYGIDVTLIERNLRLTPAERIQNLDQVIRFSEQVRARLVPDLLTAAAREGVKATLAAYGPERDD